MAWFAFAACMSELGHRVQCSRTDSACRAAACTRVLYARCLMPAYAAPWLAAGNARVLQQGSMPVYTQHILLLAQGKRSRTFTVRRGTISGRGYAPARVRWLRPRSGSRRVTSG
jgi:hypothetical protein